MAALPGRNYSRWYGQRWYENVGIHEDGTCDTGDVPGDGERGGRRPCSWYQQM